MCSSPIFTSAAATTNPSSSPGLSAASPSRMSLTTSPNFSSLRCSSKETIAARPGNGWTELAANANRRRRAAFSMSPPLCAREELHLFAQPAYKIEDDGSRSLQEPRNCLLATAWPALGEEIRARFDEWNIAAQASAANKDLVIDTIAATGQSQPQSSCPHPRGQPSCAAFRQNPKPATPPVPPLTSRKMLLAWAMRTSISVTRAGKFHALLAMPFTSCSKNWPACS